MSDLVAGGVPESPGHAAINPESAEDGIQDDSTMAPLVVRDQGEVGSSSLTDKRSGDEWEEEMAREKARRGLEAEERSTTQAKVQILRDARRVDKEEERMRAKAKEAGRKFSELEDAGRAKVGSGGMLVATVASHYASQPSSMGNSAHFWRQLNFGDAHCLYGTYCFINCSRLSH